MLPAFHVGHGHRYQRACRSMHCVCTVCKTHSYTGGLTAQEREGRDGSRSPPPPPPPAPAAAARCSAEAARRSRLATGRRAFRRAAAEQPAGLLRPQTACPRATLGTLACRGSCRPRLAGAARRRRCTSCCRACRSAGGVGGRRRGTGAVVRHGQPRAGRAAAAAVRSSLAAAAASQQQGEAMHAPAPGCGRAGPPWSTAPRGGTSGRRRGCGT